MSYAKVLLSAFSNYLCLSLSAFLSTEPLFLLSDFYFQGLRLQACQECVLRAQQVIDSHSASIFSHFWQGVLEEGAQPGQQAGFAGNGR